MADSIKTSTLPTLPLKNTVVYPHLMVPLAVGRPRSLRLLEELPPDDRVLAVATQFDESTEEASWHEVHHVGTRVRIQQLLKLPDGTVQIAVQGIDRIRLTNAVSEQPYLVTEVEEYPEDKEELPELEGEALLRSAHTSFQQLVAIAPYLPAELVSAALAIEDRVHLAYFIAHHVRLSVQQRQEILELGSAQEKLERLLGLMAHELEVLELGRQMQSRAEESIGKSQREYFLREQLKAIQRELGEMDQEAAEIAELRERIEAAGMPQEALREAERELKRLERIPSASPESSVIRTYLELVVSLPWNRTTGGEIDVAKSRRVLDEDHYDLEKVKQRIVDHLDVPFDLSRVMFICTANTLDTVPPALRDRMEVLQLSGYTEEEKVQIARRFLLPKQLAANGLTRKEVRFGDRMIRLVIREYTREAGVRNLERELAGVLRRVAAQVAAGETSGQVRIDDGWVRDALGKRRFFNDSAERGGRPGVATGLTWSPVGGEIIFVEATQMPGKGELQLTGQLGEVMKESASAALSYLKTRSSELGISRE